MSHSQSLTVSSTVIRKELRSSLRARLEDNSRDSPLTAGSLEARHDSERLQRKIFHLLCRFTRAAKCDDRLHREAAPI